MIFSCLEDNHYFYGMMKYFTLILAFMISVSVFAQDSIVAPRIAIKIAVGKTIQLKNHSIKFIEVIEDSRCPEYVNCIWVGRARISVEITDELNTVIKKELIFGQARPGEIVDNNLFSTEEYIVKGFTLSPYPNSEEKTEPNTYRLLIETLKN